MTVSALLAAMTGCGGDSHSRGPLTVGAGQGVSIDAAARKPQTWGQLVLYNTSRRPAVLDDARLVRPDPGLHVLLVRAAGRDRQLGTLGSDTWPPTSDLFNKASIRPVRGFVVKTDVGQRVGTMVGSEILFALRADHRGRFAAHGVLVDYHVGGHHYRQIYPDVVVLCVPHWTRTCFDPAIPDIPQTPPPRQVKR